MSDRGNVYKSSFIKFNNGNTRVIDSSALVAKRMEGFTGVLREQEEETAPIEPVYDEEGNLICDASIDMLTGEEGAEYSEIPEEKASKEDNASEGDAGFIQKSPAKGYVLSPDEVRAECEEMLKKANAEAENIRSLARDEAENIKNSAKNEGYNAGYAEAMAELENEKFNLEQYKIQLNDEYEALLANAEPKMVETITEVYEHVFGENFYSRRDVMVCLINRALMHVETSDSIIIHISPADYDMLIGMKNSLFEKVPLKAEPEINQREDFEKGMAKIETPFGIVDCSIDTELKELRRALTVLSYGGGSHS